MFTEIATNPKYEKLLISTGNILNVLDNAIPLRKSHEELLDSLKLCSECASGRVDDQIEFRESDGQVLRANAELKQKITENARNEISIGVKLFMNKNSKECVKDAANALMSILNVDYVDNVVLAYHPNQYHTKISPGTPDVTAATLQHQSELKWSQSANDSDINDLKELWFCLEDFALQKQINQLGIADLDTEALQLLCQSARVQPVIAQINLAACCIVPPTLKEFCTQRDIQLLTHSDPEVLLTDENFILPNYTVDWSLRYQVHVRCRGVLTAKGYLLGARKCLASDKVKE
ncbi:glutamate--cysteine ligase regulatory subunit [Glossina fuscipes]|uniref:GCS light chain n=1 Tax=Glossina fuscipes TaxID=7396 RepID=A0A9C5ZDV9_9MUSC|nr:glutamate--cysteine ligase regulatory subunit [Glossina fuscipes]